MQRRYRVLIADREPDSDGDLVRHLKAQQMEVSRARNGAEAVSSTGAGAASLPHLLILDTAIAPDGWSDLCRRLRRQFDGPILIASDGGSTSEQLLAFEVGADDFIVKPFSPAVLAARICALLRRAHHSSREAQMRFGDLVVDQGRREMRIKGQPVVLTTLQFDLLWLLAERAGTVVSRDEAYTRVYKAGYNGIDRSLDVSISRLRQKLGDSSRAPRFLKTVRGQGYQFIPAAD